MLFADHLSKEEISKFNQLRKAERNKKELRPKRSKEKLSTHDIEDLMNMHMDTYERRRGALRRK